MLYKLRDAIEIIIWISSHACEILFTETEILLQSAHKFTLLLHSHHLPEC